jgi:hypothetical protein
MNKQLFPIALLATGLGATAFAQVVSQPDEPELAVLPEFKTVDANENGMIEAAETEGLTEQLKEEHQISFQFEAVDRNRDGMINTQEYVAYDAVLKERLGIA